MPKAEQRTTSTFTSGGEEYTLRFDFNAIASFGELTGENIFALFGGLADVDVSDAIRKSAAAGDEKALAELAAKTGTSIFRKFTPTVVRSLVHAGLNHSHPTLTLKQAGVIIDGIEGASITERYGKIIQIITAAFTRDFASEAPAKKND